MPEHRLSRKFQDDVSGAPAENIPRIGMAQHLDPEQWSKLVPHFSEVIQFASNTKISSRGDKLDHSLLLIGGLVARKIPRGSDSKSTCVALQFPGDFVDLHAFPLKRLDHDVVSLTQTTLALIRHDALATLLDHDINLSRKLWMMTMVDASIHRHWVMRNSALRAFARTANFLSEFDARITSSLGSESNCYPLPITQSDMADATGLTNVHVNRTLRELREDNCCSVAGGNLTIHDRTKLHERGQFDPAFLYLPKHHAKL